MKTLGLFIGVVALAYLQPSVLGDAGAAWRGGPPPSPGRRGPRPIMPLLPSLEERRHEMSEALRNSNPALRLPAPLAGLRRAAGMVRPPRPWPEHDKKKATPSAMPIRRRTADKRPQREPQPDFAGRVDLESQQHVDGGLMIINGNKAKLGQFPWQAGILADFLEAGQTWCGGSIVHSRWILTAAHCIDDQPFGYTISVGSIGSENGTEPSRQVWKNIDETYQHPAYSPYFIDNDIGFIKLPTPIEYGPFTRPVRLPSWSMALDMMVGRTGTVSGWGKDSDDADWITSYLMYVDNTIDDGRACYDTYGNVWIPNKICVKTDDKRSFCSGDSGGAFTIKEDDGAYTQIGIVSFGAKESCSKGFPTAYTRLASFLDFVEDTTNILIRD